MQNSEKFSQEDEVTTFAYKRGDKKFNISKFFKSRIFIILLCVVLTVCSFFAGMHVDYVTRYKTLKDYELLTSVIDYVNKYYYKDLDKDTLIYYACKGVVDNLDPYSMIYTESVGSSQNAGYYGMEISYAVNGQFRVMWVDEGSPAEKAGIVSGDYITHVNGQKVEGDFIEYFVALMGNKKIGDAVTLKIKSTTNSEEKIVSMIAEEKSLDVVKSVNDFSKLPGNVTIPSSVGYIKFSNFYDDTLYDFQKAVEDFRQAGKSKLILDLRDNTGGEGLVLQKIAKYLLKPTQDGRPKTVMRLKKSDGTYVDYNTTGDGEYIFTGITDSKIIVLTNSNTASSSEALIGALLLDGNTEIVGSNTYGKGVGQTTRPFPDSNNPLFNIKLTIGRFYFTGDVSEYVKYATEYIDCIDGVGFSPKEENIVYTGRNNSLLSDPVMLRAIEIIS